MNFIEKNDFRSRTDFKNRRLAAYRYSAPVIIYMAALAAAL